MLHLDWEDCSIVLQSEGRLTMGTERSSEQQVSWQALLAMPREEQLAWAQDRKEKGKANEDVLLVVEQRDLPAVRSLHGLLSRMDPGGLGVLVLLDSDAQLYPTVADWVGEWPWRMRRVTRFERALCYENGTKRWAFAATSTRASRLNGLQPGFTTTRLGDVAEPMYRCQVRVPEVDKATCAIQLDNQLVAEVQKKVGLVGAQAQVWPGKVKYVKSVIFHILDQDWVDWLIRQYSQTPHFALMLYAEYTGTELQDCELVAEVYMCKHGAQGQALVGYAGGCADWEIRLCHPGQALQQVQDGHQNGRGGGGVQERSPAGTHGSRGVRQRRAYAGHPDPVRGRG